MAPRSRPATDITKLYTGGLETRSKSPAAAEKLSPKKVNKQLTDTTTNSDLKRDGIMTDEKKIVWDKKMTKTIAKMLNHLATTFKTSFQSYYEDCPSLITWLESW